MSARRQKLKVDDNTSPAAAPAGSAPTATGSQRSDPAAGAGGSGGQPVPSQQPAAQGGTGEEGASRPRLGSGEVDYVHYREPLLDDD